jgi:uncharacterized membrane protein YfcA
MLTSMHGTEWLLAGLFAVVAALYASVGHGGASGYLAMMALVGVAPAVMKPTALVLNLVVSATACARFARSGHFSWRRLWPFITGSIPLAFLGGALAVSDRLYHVLVGVALVAAALRLAIDSSGRDAKPPALPPVAGAIGVGAGLGLLSGVTGVGGGIYLSPVLLFMRWATTKQTAGIAAAFIFFNSAAGLAGNLASVKTIPGALPWWVAAVFAGGFIGSGLGADRFSPLMFRRVLAAVLLLAAWKLVLS